MLEKKPKKVLILGSGGLKIGQAGEFDYSGSQAIKALKEEGIFTILINPNIATVQTDSSMADKVYLEPLSPFFVIQVIEKEQPDAILLSFGGQTALNLGLKLEEMGIFQKWNIQILGTSVASIRKTEDRELFKQALATAGIKVPLSFSCETLEAAKEAASHIGFPVMMRSGFSLGGLGSGRIADEKELEEKVVSAFAFSPQVLIEEYLQGWKEIEYEIVRDQWGNAVTVCNMENMDPMGIHTGESIVVAPSQTLNNREYYFLRKIGLEVAHLFQIVGECNIQYALNPKNGDYRVIEMNARLSRSSALASKATGYPLAFVAAKIALGFGLFEIKNSVTKETTAFFEPALDYLVVKMPRWDLSKMRTIDRKIGSEMKSVGEVMAIGKSFPEALQKAIRMLNIGADHLGTFYQDFTDPLKEITEATDQRLFALHAFFKQEGATVQQAHEASHIDCWFLQQIKNMVELEQKLCASPLSESLLLEAKQAGFSDRALAGFKGSSEKEIRTLRKKVGIIPHVKQIDTLAGEFEAKTNYLYLTYHAEFSDLSSPLAEPYLIIGSGPYAIGSSVEFDWCAVNTARSLRKRNQRVVMINSNPETVSTDYDESDRLYFEELSFERIQDILEIEKPKGIIVSVGGQVANNLVIPLHQEGFPILGTSPVHIDQAENRQKFSTLLRELSIDQPAWMAVSSRKEVDDFINKVGFPVLIRPSYVLSGSAMNVVFTQEDLAKYLKSAEEISKKYPIVITQFIMDAKELEIDGVAQKGEVIISALSEHIENAGVHSGDATLVFPPQWIYLETIRRAKGICKKIVKALAITGPFNIQFLAKEGTLQVIECNVRASRSFPFISKITGHSLIDIMVSAFLGEAQEKQYDTFDCDKVGVKAPQFSFHRLKGANPVAHVEMASTGEVACLGLDFKEAFLKAWLATDQTLKGKKILVSISDEKKSKFLEPLKRLEEQGWEILSTEGTHEFLSKHGVVSSYIFKASEKFEPNITTLIRDKKVDLIINIPKNSVSSSRTDGFKIRRFAIDHHIPLMTNWRTAQKLLECLFELNQEHLLIRSGHDYTE